MATALEARRVRYNAAFAQSDADNPNANARIFLTDGAHNADAYANGHLVHKVPTQVISFGSGLSPDDQARLQTIANDTGGTYYPQVDSSQLQSVMNTIGRTIRSLPHGTRRGNSR